MEQNLQFQNPKNEWLLLLDVKMLDVFIKLSEEENLEAVEVAQVTDDNRLKMIWKGKTIVDLSRSFLDTNGVKQFTNVKVAAPKESEYYFSKDIIVNYEN